MTRSAESSLDPQRATLDVLATALARGALRATDLARATLARIDRAQPKLHAFVHVDAWGVMTSAASCDAALRAGASRGPLHGVPCAAKDVYLTRDMPTTACSRILLDDAPLWRDAHVVGRLRDAGAIVTGKLATYEFATGGPSFDLPFPPARNPWALTRTTGGSSSGSAAAVAAGLCPFALGTDTGGSLRTPAAYCGVSSYRPTPGEISCDGILPLAPSVDTAGLIAPRARDCAYVAAALDADSTGAAQFVETATRRSVRDLRVGIVEDLGADVALDEATRRAVDRAARMLAAARANVSAVVLPPARDFTVAFRIAMLAEAWAIHRRNLETRPERYGQAFRVRVAPGRRILAGEATSARHLALQLRRQVAAAFERFDLLVMPVSAAPAPHLEAMRLRDTFAAPQPTAAFSIGGNPVVTLPVLLSEAGMPVGLQLAAARGDDRRLLAAACAIESLLPFEAERNALLDRIESLPELPEAPSAAASERETDRLLAEADVEIDRMRERLRELDRLWPAALAGTLGGLGALANTG
jgi:aspartyl-tRNA(Asn)/glutamyl-tRNA(Gln) amidotransferase subunit A